MYNFQVGNTYSFKAYAPDILGSDFNNVVIRSIMSYNTAIKQREVSSVHAQIYSQLPAGTPNQPTKYNYLEIEFPNGSVSIMGLPWIREDTIQLVDHVTFEVTIAGLNSSDSNRIAQALQANGITNFVVKIL